MIDENDQYESFIDDHMIGNNKYRCLISGCENTMSAPEWKAGDGICRSHREGKKVDVIGFPSYKTSSSNGSNQSSKM